MNELALFAGVGGGILAGKLLGWRTVCAVELNAYCARRLMQRQNEGHLSPFPIWDDVCTFDGRPWNGIVDVISGGFPCQDISVAGKQCGLNGTRSGLWWEMLRIIGDVRPRHVFIENVAALTTNGGVAIIESLASLGYVGRHGIFGANDIGANHERKRIWFVAHAKSITGLQTDQAPVSVRKNWKSWTVPECGYWRKVPTPERAIPKHSIPGLDDGMAYWMECTRPAGNGQVPAVARLAWEVLS